MNKSNPEWLVNELSELLSKDYRGVQFYNFFMNSIRHDKLVGVESIYIMYINRALRYVEENDYRERNRNVVLSLTLRHLFDIFLAEYLAGTFDFHNKKEEIYSKYVKLLDGTLKSNLQ